MKLLMKVLLVLLLLLPQSGCSSSLEVRLLKDHNGIDKELTSYVQEFIHASNGKVKKDKFNNFSMGFRDYQSDSAVVGTCHYVAYEVDISRRWWKNTTSQSEKIELVFHELGHCILLRGHTQKPTSDDFMGWLERLGFDFGLFEKKGLLSDGCPASFMHPYTLGEECIDRHFNYYTNELFKTNQVNYVENKYYNGESSDKLSCRKPQVVNKTNTWVRSDEDTFRRAKKTCIERYHSCLKTFYKNTNNGYSAICE